MKIAINRSNHDFSLSKKAVTELVNLGFTISLTDPSSGNYINPEAEIIDRKHNLREWDYDRYILNDDRGIKNNQYALWDLRINLHLIKIIETLGDKASGKKAKLKIVEIPDDIEWNLISHGHAEYIEEKHRIWY